VGAYAPAYRDLGASCCSAGRSKVVGAARPPTAADAARAQRARIVSWEVLVDRGHALWLPRVLQHRRGYRWRTGRQGANLPSNPALNTATPGGQQPTAEDAGVASGLTGSGQICSPFSPPDAVRVRVRVRATGLPPNPVGCARSSTAAERACGPVR
jgi:hypothetical protein